MLCVMALINYINIRSVNNDMANLFNDRTIPIEQLGAVNAEILKSRGDLYKARMFPDDIDKIRQDVVNQFQKADKNLEAYKSTYLIPAEKEGLSQFEPAWSDFKKESLIVLENFKNNNVEPMLSTFKKGGRLNNNRTAAQAAIEQLIEINKQEADRLKKQGDQSYATAITVSIIVTAAAALFAVLAGFSQARSISPTR